MPRMPTSVVLDLDGPVHLADFGGSGPVVVLVHGLGGSHANWLALGPRLAPRCRVVALDLPGFGRTPLAGRRARVEDHRRLLDRLLERTCEGPVVLCGNSMGGLVALLEAGLRPERVAGLVLVDPALPRPPGSRVDAALSLAVLVCALPVVGPRYLTWRARRIGPEALVADTLALCARHPSRIPADVVAAEVALARERAASPERAAAFVDSTRSLVALLARRSHVDGVVARVQPPTLVVHGAADRLVPVAAARLLAAQRPDWSLRVLDDVGHVPQLEAADRLAAEIVAWLDGPGRSAAERATRRLRLPTAAAAG